MSTVIREIRHAVRRLARDWRFTFAAVLLLGVGIGANTAIFSVVNAALLPRHSATAPHRLVNLYQRGVNPAGIDANTFPAYLDMAAETDVFASATAVLVPNRLNFLDQGTLRPAIVEHTTASYLSVLGLSPARGRWFTEDEDKAGAPVVAVVGYEAWVRKFGRDPSIVGRMILVEGVPVTVVGVGPVGLGSDLNPGITTDLWLPIAAVPALGLPAHLLDRHPEEAAFFVKARLRDEITLAQAQAAMDVLGARLKAQYPRDDPGKGIAVYSSDAVRVHPQFDGPLSVVAAVVLVVVGLVLAVACSNLATLLLLRGTARRKELSLRLALGATRGQLIRHLLTESLLISVAGGILGCLLAWWTVRWTATFDLAVIVDLSLDLRALTFAAAISVVTGLAFGLVPALRSTRVDLVPALRGTAEVPGRGPRGLTLKNALIVFQVAVSAVLLGVTTLVLQMIDVAQASRVGFAVDDVAIVETDTRYAGGAAGNLSGAFQTIQQRIAAMPGIQAAVIGRGLPMQPTGVGLLIEGDEPAASQQNQVSRRAVSIWAGPGYFDVLRLPILFGRAIDGRDQPGTPRVAVISEALARRYFGLGDSASAIGRRFRIDQEGGVDQWIEVVGVTRDTGTADRQEDLLEGSRPAFYRPFVQWGLEPNSILARTSAAPESLLVALQRELRGVNPNLPVVTATTMAQYLDESLKLPKMVAAFLGVLGALGLCLAGLGLYAVVAFDVARRSREIGIRMALGARARQVIWTVTKEVALLLGTGTVVGIALTILVVGVIASVRISTPGITLYRPTVDSFAMLAIAAFMAFAGVVAAIVPARRAARIDPLKALKAAD